MEPTRESYLHVSSEQKLIFYLLMAASIGYLIWQIWARVKVWRTGRKNEGEILGWEGLRSVVLGQRKVQNSRPDSGAPMHLMIFYGFMSLVLATTLLSIAEYGHIIGIRNFHTGGYYLAYETVFDLMGLMLLIGLIWAGVRRWHLASVHGTPTVDAETGRPNRTENPLSYEKGDRLGLSLLMVLTVTGFLVEGARISNQPSEWDAASPVGNAIAQMIPSISNSTYVTIWWIHAVLVALFFVVLPKMRLKHIVMAMLSAWNAPDRPMGHLRKITMEEVEATGKIGATESADYSSWHLLSLDACMSCGRCMEVCPAYGAGKGLNPKQVVADLFAVAGTDKPVTEAMTEEALWSCTTCHACVEACPVLIRHVDLIVDGRRNLVAEGKLSGSSATMLRQVGSTGHAWGEQPDKKEEWMKGLDVPLVRNGAEYDWILWVGCAGATDPAAVKTTQALAKLLKKAGVKFACLGKEESCTGDPARRVGDEFTFQEMQGQNQTVFDRYGIKKIVTACPHCLNTFRNEYGDFGADLEVWHHTQLLAELVEAGKLESANPEQGEVTYHDPCYLARVNNESNAPRLLVGDCSEYDRDKAAIQKYLEDGPEKPGVLAEPEHRAHKTLCCGAGGGMMWMDDDPESRPSSVRINELVDTGAKTVAVSCPFCRIMLDAGLSTEGHDEINLVDMAELLAEANEDK